MFEHRFGSCFVALVLAALLLTGLVAPAAADTTGGPSLYKRLGGYDALAAVTDDFIVRLVTDKRLAKFFGGVSENSKLRIRQLVLDQLCAATGGPCVYIGRDMRTAHKGLGITENDWNASVEDLTATLDKFKVGQAERTDLFAALATIKPDVIDH